MNAATEITHLSFRAIGSDFINSNTCWNDAHSGDCVYFLSNAVQVANGFDAEEIETIEAIEVADTGTVLHIRVIGGSAELLAVPAAACWPVADQAGDPPWSVL